MTDEVTERRAEDGERGQGLRQLIWHSRERG